MNRLALVLGVVLVMAIMCQPSGLRAQDPNDPGEPDTLYFTPGGMHSTTGDTLYIWPDTFPQDMIIRVNAWNDSDIYAFSLVFTDLCHGPPSNADLDPEKNNYTESPKAFDGSRAEHFAATIYNAQAFPPIFRLGGVCVTQPPMPPGDGLLGTFVFTVFDTGRVCIDTTFYPPSLNTHFVTEEPQQYAPVFEKKTFIISPCQYSQADPDHDGGTDLADLVYLINYVLKHGPRPCVLESGDMNCDGSVNVVDIVFFVNYLFRDGPPPGYCP